MATKKTTAGGDGGGGEPNPVALWSQRARGVGLLAGFAITTLVSRGEGLPWADAALRGLLGAFAMALLCWWCALTVIRALLRSAAARQNAEIRDAAAQAAAAREEGAP
jgi:hypothetical protein